MTHAFLVDFRKRSTTASQEVSVPITVLETPPLKVVAVRLYHSTPYGRRVSGEIWADEVPPQLARRRPLPKSPPTEEAKAAFAQAPGEEVFVLVETQPHLVSGVPTKTPDLFEVRVSGEDFDERRTWARDLLGKEVSFEDFAREGEMVDVVAVTKGKGFQGHIKRFGVKLQPRKNSKHRRMIGTLGPHNPSYVSYRIPQAGQMGYHRRTEYNKRLLRVVKDPRTEPIQPAGGFLHYGEIRNGYAILHGSVPGPARRLVRLRLPIRFHWVAQEKVDIRYRSVASKQGG